MKLHEYRHKHDEITWILSATSTYLWWNDMNIDISKDDVSLHDKIVQFWVGCGEMLQPLGKLQP